jgi:hypothetical protein
MLGVEPRRPHHGWPGRRDDVRHGVPGPKGPGTPTPGPGGSPGKREPTRRQPSSSRRSHAHERSNLCQDTVAARGTPVRDTRPAPTQAVGMGLASSHPLAAAPFAPPQVPDRHGFTVAISIASAMLIARRRSRMESSRPRLRQTSMERLWSPVATRGNRWRMRRRRSENDCRELRPVAAKMPRKEGSPVRVRQRALQSAGTRRFLVQTDSLRVERTVDMEPFMEL